MTQRHKHYNAIVAFAEGRAIQWRHDKSCAWQAWKDSFAPAFQESHEYRVKPATIKVWVALFKKADARWTGTCNSDDIARSWKLSKNFVRWIMEGEEVEV